MRTVAWILTGTLLAGLVSVVVPAVIAPAQAAPGLTQGGGHARVHLTTHPVSTDDTTTDDTGTATGQASKVQFWVGAQQITGLTKVPAGSVLKVRNVPIGSTVELYNFKDSAETFDVKQTKKASMWKSEILPPATRIQVRVTAPDGSKALVNFATQEADNTFSATVTPDGKLWGTGIPLVLDLGVAIPDKDKAEVESALKVTATNDLGEASWHWMSSSELVFRPRDYWPEIGRAHV